MTVLTIRGREVTGPIPWAKATAMARSWLRHWPDLTPDDIAFL